MQGREDAKLRHLLSLSPESKSWLEIPFELLFKFYKVGNGNMLNIRCIGMVGYIFLVVIFGRIKFSECFYFRNNRLLIFFTYPLYFRFDDLLLRFVPVKSNGTILCAHVVSLPVQLRWIHACKIGGN